MSITVNIVSYRYGHLAAHAIESVLAQTLQAGVKIRFFDDGVGDCGHLVKLYPDVEVIERERNLGVVASFQDALDRVETDRCLNLGADNWLQPDTLERLVVHSEDIVSYDICITGPPRLAEPFAQRAGASRFPSGFHVWQFRKLNIDQHNYIHGSSLFNAQMAQRYGYRRSASGNQQTEEDWAMWRDMLHGGATHKHVAEPMLYYRRHAANFNP